ncbi:glycosyltransferase [Pseudomonas sp. Xaverov 259]|uniref:glycosyltransferase n=1 Tax=Pseudomonas sp. Xaverov 259 TaxID=2666086 RepID=UPI00214C2274|nr:glycosyltransferase [Pseudomonas sp. Xaverov 259]
MNSISNQIIARPAVAPTLPLLPPLSRLKRDTASPQQEQVATRANGDSELAMQYAIALNLAGHRTPVNDFDYIPPHSTFGQWWRHLHDAFQSPDVQQWMKALGVDTTSVKIDPKSGKISFFLERFLDPAGTLHTLGQDDSQWAALSGPILRAASVIEGELPFAPPVNSPDAPVPWQLVGRFYQEPQNLTLSGMLRRSGEISHQTYNFKTLDPGRFADKIQSLSEETLQEQKAELGDIHNWHRAGAALQRLAMSLEDGSKKIEELQTELARPLPLSAHGTYQPTGIGAPNEVSLQQFLQDHGWDIPTNSGQLENLASALLAPNFRSATHGNLGGALTWPEPLAPDDQARLRLSINEGTFGDLSLKPFKSVLDYLLNGRPISAEEQLNPRQLIDDLVNSPRGIALGQAIQATFEARFVKGSATDWLLAALAVGKYPDRGGETNIEGYTLVSATNSHKSASTVVKELEAHLLAGGLADSEQKASALAYIMFASRAPQFLVGGIPKEVTMSSHSWVSFTTAVARVEAKAPGATSRMNYAQIMLAADTAPISDEERQVEYAAQNEAIKTWAVAYGLGYPTTDTALSEVRTAFDQHVREMSEAAALPPLETPTTQAIAIEYLKQACPTMDPALFDKKCITSQPSTRVFPGPYSLLDLLIDGRALRSPPPDSDNGKPGVWVSSSDKINISDLLPVLKTLPDPIKQFNQDFRTHSDAVKKATSAQLKVLISRLPLEDRQNLEFGEIVVRREIDYDTPSHPLRTEQGVLLVETRRTVNGQISVMTYAIDRLKGTVTRRPGKAYKENQPSGGWYSARGKRYDRIKPEGEYPAGITQEREGATGVPKNFASARTQYLVDAMVEDMELPALGAYSRGTTTFQTEHRTVETIREVILGLIPFRSAINNFNEGKLGEGAVDLAFDIFGFLVGAGVAAKAAKASFVGASALSKAAQVLKIVGRAAVGALNPLGGIDDLARGALKGLKFVAGKAYKGVNHLRGSYRRVNLLALAKKADIAEGTFSAANGARSTKALAKFDEATHKWYALDPRTKQAYGKPLENFVPDVPKPGDSNSLRAIASDDAIQNVSKQHGLAANGTIQVGQETVERQAVMFQGNWHEYDALKQRAIGPPLKDFKPNRVAASGEVRSLDNLHGYETRYIAEEQLSTKGLQNNVFVGSSKREYVKVDGRLFESQVKDGQRVILHPKGTAADIPVKELGPSGWAPLSRSERLPGGASSTPTPFRLGDRTYVVPMDDIKIVETSGNPFRINYKNVDQEVAFDSTAGAWRSPHEQGHHYYWRSAEGQWQRGTLADSRKAKKVSDHRYNFVEVSSIPSIPKQLAPVPKTLNYFWAGQEIPSHLVENMTQNAMRTPGYKSVLHVDADSPAVFKQIESKLKEKVPGVTVLNLNEDPAFKQLKNGEMYRYFRQGQGKNLAAASDVARYPIMNKHGGFYLDTDDLIQNNVDAAQIAAGADDVLLGLPVTHQVSDYKTFYNTSNFATRPGNPVLEEMIKEMNKRFATNKSYFANNRPTVARGPDGKVGYTPEFKAYEAKIFDTVGPNMFNDILKTKRPDMYELGFDSLTKEAMLVDGKLVPHGTIVNVQESVSQAYARQGLVPPITVPLQIQKTKEHYFPLRYKFRVNVGADHSWINT